MFAHCTGIERGLVCLSERAGESLTRLVSFTRVSYRPLSGVNIRSEGLLWQERKPKCFDRARLIGDGPFSLVAVSLPPNWKETNSFPPIRWQHRRPDEDASSSTNSNASNSATFRQKLNFRTITAILRQLDAITRIPNMYSVDLVSNLCDWPSYRHVNWNRNGWSFRRNDS